MKFTVAAALFVSLLSLAHATTSDTEVNNQKGYTSSQIGAYDETYDAETMVYDGTCGEQSNCLGMTVKEVQRRCGSGSCEWLVCYFTQLGMTSADAWTTAAMAGQDGSDGAEAACKFNPAHGVDHAGNMASDATFEEGGCLNTDNSQGKGYWDETCIDPETADVELTGVSGTNKTFSKFCQVAYPGQTVHFMLHSYHRLDADGKNAEAVTCSGSASVGADDGNAKKGRSYCSPSTSATDAEMGQTFFPATDGTTGGTCSDEEEGVECVWSFTAPTECLYEEVDPTCYLTQESVDTVDNLCGEDADPVVEYFEHPSNPNAAPPRIPFHDIKHNTDGTVSFKMYNPYGNYVEPIDYTSTSFTQEGHDVHNMYVVYDQANEIGNEVCDLQTGLGSCATDTEYTAKCRSDGVSIVTVFAAGFDSDSGAAQQITNEVGTDVFECCPETYQPMDHFSTAQTSAWTFLIHCDCPEEEVDADRRQLKESISSKFQKGELFSGNTKQLYNFL